MTRASRPSGAGYDALRRVVQACLRGEPLLAVGPTPGAGSDGREWSVRPSDEITASAGTRSPGRSASGPDGSSSPPAADSAESLRLAALVDLARQGDSDAFGRLYDHYNGPVFRFVYYRVSSQALAEDLASETFFRALRSITSFQWQGKDFGAWLMTIARNIVVDHYKSARSRLESPTSELADRQETAANPEEHVVESLTHDLLRSKLAELPAEQQECLVLRFLNSMSIAETAKVLGRSEGAVKQLQLRAVRNLARLMPPDLR